MPMIQIKKDELVNLLKCVQRKHTNGGKSNSQVESCLLKMKFLGNYTKVSVTSLVKDGVSSVANFSINVNDIVDTSQGDFIPIPDIDAFLGVLKYHGKNVTLTYTANKNLQGFQKTKIVSGKKQTTLATNSEALAYLSSRETLQEWHEKSMEIAQKIDVENGSYLTDYDKSHYKPIKAFASYYDLDSTDLFEAFRCDGMNGQKTGRYEFQFDSEGLAIVTGKTIQGKTKTRIATTNFRNASIFVEGGLEEAMKLATGPVNLHFIMFEGMRQPTQAGYYGVIIDMGDSWIYQTSVVGESNE